MSAKKTVDGERPDMIYDVMASRRSVRRFKPEAPDRATIGRLIDAAITAPSASNQQPWRFVVVARREVIARLAAAVREATARVARHIEPMHEEAFRTYSAHFTRFEDAPVVIVVLFRDLPIVSRLADRKRPAPEWSDIDVLEGRSGIISAAMAAQNLLLMAHDLRLGAAAMTGPLVASAEIREILELTPSWNVALFIPVGFPAEDPPPVERKRADQVTRWIE